MSPPVADSTREVDKVDKKQVQRRINKPLIEKRRRARINECLAQLKSMVLEAGDNAKSPRSSKLEKADILEMTVEFIKKRLTTSSPLEHSPIYRGNGPVESPTKEPANEYVAGYSKCIQEISHFLEQTQTVNETIKHDVVSHISQRLQDNNSSQLPNDFIANNNNKIPLIPIKKRKLKLMSRDEQEPEVIDLSVKEESRTELHHHDQSQPLNLSTTSETHIRPTSMNSQKQSNSQTPVGFLCGGQIMLLVQVPPSMTPQQLLTQGVTSQVHQLQRNIPSEMGLVQTQTCTNVSTHSEIHPIRETELNANSQKSYTCIPVTNQTEQNPDVSEQRNEINNETDCSPSTSMGNSGNQNTGTVSGPADHWRPW